MGAKKLTSENLKGKNGSKKLTSENLREKTGSKQAHFRKSKGKKWEHKGKKWEQNNSLQKI